MAGPLGFEPRQSAPKALDLPLVDGPVEQLLASRLLLLGSRLSLLVFRCLLLASRILALARNEKLFPIFLARQRYCGDCLQALLL